MFIILAIPLVIVAIVMKYLKPAQRKSIRGRHIVVTGGSSGIGKSFAILAAQKGANVTIIARNLDKLEEARTEIRSHARSNSQIITDISVDVSNALAIKKALEDIEKSIGPIYMLVNCAGTAICGTVEEIAHDDIKKMVDVNFFGTLFPIRAMVPKFKQRREGIIVITASQVALLGMYGYSVYSSCKFALRGLAESIIMELKPHNVSVTLVLPPDTDTPGYELENHSKPEETKRISEAGGLYQPEHVAAKMMDDALAGHFMSYIGFESAIITTLCAGMSPFSSFLELLMQTIFMGFLRLIGACYLIYFDRIVKRCYNERIINRVNYADESDEN